MENAILAADFTNGGRNRCATLTINRIINGERRIVDVLPVINKREARMIAKVMGATPWNF